MERLGNYLKAERDANAQIFSLLIADDRLNILFYEKPPATPPSVATDDAELTADQRAILHFATIVLNYFEQMVEIERTEMLPKGVFTTWRPWLRSCLRAPYFRWAWARLRDHYTPALGSAFARESENGKV